MNTLLVILNDLKEIRPVVIIEVRKRKYNISRMFLLRFLLLQGSGRIADVLSDLLEQNRDR